MIELKAIITLRGPSRDGLTKPIKDGFRPSFNYKGELVACEVWSTAKYEFVPLEESFEVNIKLPYADELGWVFNGSESFSLNIASKVIGEGKVLK